MATWIGHLRIAEKLLPHFPELDPASFAYGSLAPDFGKPLEDGSFFPSKAVSHLVIEIDDRSKVQDLVFYREQVSDSAVREDHLRYSFILGYFFHLVCDGLWGSWIGQACKRDFMDMIAELGVEAWWIMKDDWYGLDVQYAAQNPDSLFWTEVMGLKDLPLYLEHQDKGAVEDQVQRIQKFNSNPPRELLERSDFPYLSAATMERFIEEAVQFLLDYYQMIKDKRVPEGADSFQDCFPMERFVPYEAPLGEGGTLRSPNRPW